MAFISERVRGFADDCRVRLSGPIQRWGRALGVITLCAASVSAENLVANPGFEDLAGDKPSRWDQFVQPMPGAVAELSDVAHGGAYGVRLHIPNPYDKDPLNNWSQNIIGDFGGATLHISGFIRVEEAKEAALLIQLWRKKPWGVMGGAITSTDMPVYGTQDWQEVSMEVAVPEGVDFVTLRCILKGTGTAWFDDLSVSRQETEVEAKPAEGAAESKHPTPQAENEKPESDAVVEETSAEDAMDSVEATGDDALDGEAHTEPEPESAEAGVEPIAIPQDTVLPMVNQLESEVKRLRDANEVLTDTLQQIQNVNQELLKEMLAVQEELREMKEGREGASAPPLKSSKPRVPPLVPLSQSQEFTAP